MSRRFGRALAGGIMAMAIMASPAGVMAQDSLASARDLYAAAAYEEALAALNRLSAAGARPEDVRAIDQYRAFCLLALGRGTEAEQAIEAVVAADPSYHPSEREVSPRVRTAFAEVRRRTLPSLVQHKYVQAKSAFDKKDYAASAEGFGKVLELMADADLASAASKPPLSDLRVLLVGFRDLSLQALAPPPAPEPPPVAPAPVVAPPVTAAPSVAAAAAPAAPLRVYTMSDTDVAPPIPLRQQMPPYPGKPMQALRGMIEVLIDETGLVSEATMRAPITQIYDKLALAATQLWRYKPAMLDGAPVKYRKVIQIALTP